MIRYCALLLLVTLTAACGFSEYAQTERLVENIDEHRIGCEIDDPVALLMGYKQWEANRWHHYDEGISEPTPTPDPVRDDEIVLMVMLEYVWEHGCDTGRRVAELEHQLQQLSATPTPTPTP